MFAPASTRISSTRTLGDLIALGVGVMSYDKAIDASEPRTPRELPFPDAGE